MSREFTPTVYIMASRRNGTLYTGLTSAPLSRWHQHRMEEAILREKRIKKWNRAWKLKLIEKDNPDWRDLAEDFDLEPLN